MLTKEDLQAIREIAAEESARQMNIIVENRVEPQLAALAEGQKTILETLASKNRVEALEDELVFVKQVIKAMNAEIQELKKAQ